jgi:hypothetical protein
MKRYIRGVGSGLPYAQQYMKDHGGTLTIEDNIAGGTIITISTTGESDEEAEDGSAEPAMMPQPGQMPGAWPQQMPPAQGYAQPWPQQAYPQQPYPMPGYAQPTYPQQPMPQQMPQQMGMQPAYGQPWPQPTMPQATPAPITQGGAPMPSGAFEMSLSERGWQILSYLMTHESVGGADLARTFGSSQPTWSRELKALEDKGLVKKQAGGQRRELTASGRSFVQQHPQG